MTLLNKTGRYYFLFSVLIFISGSIFSFFIIKRVLDAEVDENLYLEKKRIEKEIKQAEDLTALNLFYGYRISIVPMVRGTVAPASVKDTLVFDELENEQLPFREIIFTSQHNHTSYLITLRTSLVETEDLLQGIALAMITLFGILITSMFFINRWMNRRLWKPFYETLEHLKKFEVTQSRIISLSKSDIKEFDDLNEALGAMSKRILTDYRNIKEFTENASHEIQTPLAIITGKLENIMQWENLGEDQASAIQTVYESAMRLARLNKALLLLAKIDNHQFADTELITLNEGIVKHLEMFDDIIQDKDLHITIDMPESVQVNMNPALADIFISNLIINALRHNIASGEVNIQLCSKRLIISNTGPPPNGKRRCPF